MNKKGKLIGVLIAIIIISSVGGYIIYNDFIKSDDAVHLSEKDTNED